MKTQTEQQVKAAPKKKLTVNVKKGERQINLTTTSRSDGGGATVGRC
jgi:hypothetical protein